MTNEQILGEAVRAMTAADLPGEAAVADRAAGVAVAAFLQGETVPEACRRARAFVASWMHHPSRERVDRHVVVRLAS